MIKAIFEVFLHFIFAGSGQVCLCYIVQADRIRQYRQLEEGIEHGFFCSK